jgi:hypothetical protein
MRFPGSSASPFRAANPKNKSQQHGKTARGILIAYVGGGTLYEIEPGTIESAAPYLSRHYSEINSSIVSPSRPQPPTLRHLLASLKAQHFVAFLKRSLRRQIDTDRRRKFDLL